MGHTKSIGEDELRRFLPTIRTRPIKPHTTDTPPDRAWLRYIGFCESINLACVTTTAILMQRGCNARFNASAHKTSVSRGSGGWFLSCRTDGTFHRGN